MTTLKFLGTGSAFTLKNFQTNIAIGVGSNPKWFLVDAGGDIRFSLNAAFLNYKSIDSIYISHLHADHASGLEYFGFCTYFDPSTKNSPINLYGNGELLRKGWEDTWKGGMESIQGHLLELNDFFNVKAVRPNGFFLWEQIKFTIVQAMHVMNGYSIVPSYGLMLDLPGGYKVYLTTDCQFCPSQIMDFYKQADLIVQDCETTFKSGVHAHYTDLVTLPTEIKKKMLLVHYGDNIVGDDGKVNSEWSNKAETDGFCGFPYKGDSQGVEDLIDSIRRSN
jgi:ribonuclease BN (tRNA processing enzyme)